MTREMSNLMGQNGAQANGQPSPEVVAKMPRRTYTAEYKRKVLAEADKCRQESGQIGALLRREGLYASHLTNWKKQREAGELAGLRSKKRGRKEAEETAVKLADLQRENERLCQQLKQAEVIIEAQKKLCEILGQTIKALPDGKK